MTQAQTQRAAYLPAAGDRVYLRSEENAPVMVVTEVGSWGRADYARCRWFDKNGVCHTEDFPASALTAVAADRRD